MVSFRQGNAIHQFSRTGGNLKKKGQIKSKKHWHFAIVVVVCNMGRIVPDLMIFDGENVLLDGRSAEHPGHGEGESEREPLHMSRCESNKKKTDFRQKFSIVKKTSQDLALSI